MFFQKVIILTEKDTKIISNVIQVGSSLAVTIPASLVKYFEIEKKDLIMITLNEVKKRK